MKMEYLVKNSTCKILTTWYFTADFTVLSYEVTSQYFFLLPFSSLFAAAFPGGLNVVQQIVYEKSI